MNTAEKLHTCPYRVGQKACRLSGDENCFSPGTDRNAIDPQINRCAQATHSIERLTSNAADVFIDSRGNRGRKHNPAPNPEWR